MRASVLCRSCATLLALTTFLSSTACTFVEIREETMPMSITQALQKEGDYVIVHEGTNLYHLTNITIDPQVFILRGTVDRVSPEHLSVEQLSELDKTRKRFHRKSGFTPLNEVHLYVNGAAEVEGDRRVLTLKNIQRVEVYDTHVPATVASYVASGTAIAAGVFVTLVAIILATKSSCPFVYVNDGKTFRFSGELYGGAIFPYLERDDYLPLPDLRPGPGGLELLIANRLLERQYTDLAELVVVTHPEGTRALLDAQGQPAVFAEGAAPVSAQTSTGLSRLAQVLQQDTDAYLFDEDPPTSAAINALELTFPRAADARSAQLVLHAKNSPWLDYAYGELTKKFGRAYGEWQASQRAIPKDRPDPWADEQSIPLSIEVKTGQGWKLVSKLAPIGPLASRDVLIPLPAEALSGDAVTVRIQTGYRFWEVDSAQLVTQSVGSFTMDTLSAARAVDQAGTDVASLLSKTDGRYLEQPSLDMEAQLAFATPPLPSGMVQTYFLHARGYYEYIRELSQPPERLELFTLSRPGAFPRYSKALFEGMSQELLSPEPGLSQR